MNNQDQQAIQDDNLSNLMPPPAVPQRPTSSQIYNPIEPSVQQVRTALHRPLTANQQAFVQKTLENGNKKQDEIAEFIGNLADFPPTIPDSVTMHFLKSAGVDGSDARVTRMIALAAQKHISDIVLDAMQIARMKGLGVTKKGGSTKDAKFTLTEELLDEVLKEYGHQNSRPPYHQ